MARPEEKARSMLNKWTRMKEEMKEGDGGSSSSGLSRIPTRRKRPYLASLCPHLSDAEQYRNQIIHEISMKLTKIQNPGLQEHAIRDLNDEINKLFREKYHWNKRIKELGGPDYNRIEALDSENDSSLGGSKDSIISTGKNGYRYFGRAKDLPGVRESFAHQSASVVKKKRGDVYKYITMDYYGWKEDEDGLLLKAEKEASEQRRQLLVQHRQEQALSRLDGKTLDNVENEEDISDEDEDLYSNWIGGSAFTAAQTRIFQTEEILAQIVLEQKKKDLLNSLEI